MTPRLPRWIAPALALLALALLSSQATAQSPTRFVVTSASDSGGPNDVSPGDGKCEDSQGRCTLRAAVDEANATAGAVVIVLPGLLPGTNSGNYVLSAVAPNMAINTYEDANQYGDLDLGGSFSELTIQGTGTPGPQVSISPNDRILDIAEDATVRIERVWLTGGTARAGRNGNSDGSGVGVDGEDGEDGGGIRVKSGATLMLDQVTISGCFTQSGGNGATPASAISRTKGGDAGDGGDGGGIYIAEGASVQMRRTNVAENGTGDAGGAGSGQANGQAADGGAGGDAGNGGGIFNLGSLTVESSTVYNNTCGDAGAGGSGVNGGSDGPLGSGGSGGGIADFQTSGSASGSTTLTNTIVAQNSSGSSAQSTPRPGSDLYDGSFGQTFSGSYDLVGTEEGVPQLSLSNSQIGGAGSGINPMITGQNSNGDYAVPAYELASGSPAVNAGTAESGLDYDARGFLVPGSQGGTADIGAFERGSTPTPVDLQLNEIDVKTPTGGGEFAEIKNVGDYAVQLDDYALVSFGSDGNACLTANLYGELQPGEIFVVGDDDVDNVDQRLTFDLVQNACGSTQDDQFADGDGALALIKGTAGNLSGVSASSQSGATEDEIVFGPNSSSAQGGGSGQAQRMVDLCSAFGLGAGCGLEDADNATSIQRDNARVLYINAPSPGLNNVFAPLPVRWLAVEAFVNDAGEAYVTWATASERGVEDFAVELFDGGAAGWVERERSRAAGLDGRGARYEVRLGRLPAGTQLVRVRENGLDGSRDFSEVVSLVVLPKGGIRVAPNPVRDVLHVYADGHTGPIKLEITDASGRPVPVGIAAQGGGTTSYDLSHLPRGSYLVRVGYSDAVTVTRLQKL